MPKAAAKGASAQKSTTAVRPARAGTSKVTATKKAVKATSAASKKASKAPARAVKAAKAPAKAKTKALAPSKAVKAAKAPLKAAVRAPARVAAPARVRPVSDKFLEEQRLLLIGERETHTRQAEHLKAEADQLAADMEPGDIQFDEESGEGATMNVERERDLTLSAQARAAVEEIDRALLKIDAGTYGICEGCGQPIPRARLKVLPYAALCVACKSGGLSRR